MLEHTMGTLVEHACAAFQRQVAVICGDRKVTYAEQRSNIRRTGRALLALGLEKGDRVAILMSDRPELLDVFYGITWSGLTVVPMNARLGREDHQYILENSGARAVVYDQKMADRVADVATAAGTEFLISVSDDALIGSDPKLLSRLTANQPDSPGQPEVAMDDRLGLFYTGGTTGRPKGVEHTHRTFCTALYSELVEMGLGEGERFAHVAPLTHSGGLFVLPVWMRGGTNVVLGGFDPDQLLDTIEAERITSMMLVPTMLYVVLDHIGAGNDTSSVSTIIYGASPCGQERLMQGMERFGNVFSQLYGQTEAPNQLNVLHKIDHAEAVESGDLSPLASCGRPVTIADVRVVDEDLNEVPTGESGEIVARGPHIMKGYWNRPDETAEALAGGWLHTGDIGMMDDRRFVSIVDRKKDMIISGGFNVYPKEVESTLFTHPAVRDVCVIGVPDDKWGESVKAVVVKDAGAEVNEAELIGWVKERKGSVIAPKTVEFRDEIPLTAVGKHDKPALRSAYWGGRNRAVN